MNYIHSTLSVLELWIFAKAIFVEQSNCCNQTCSLIFHFVENVLMLCCQTGPRMLRIQPKVTFHQVDFHKSNIQMEKIRNILTINLTPRHKIPNTFKSYQKQFQTNNHYVRKSFQDPYPLLQLSSQVPLLQIYVWRKAKYKYPESHFSNSV